MSLYALMAMLTPARENITKEFGLHAWFMRYDSITHCVQPWV